MKYGFLYDCSKQSLEKWILNTLDTIHDQNDPRIEGLYIAAKAMSFDCAEITDTIIFIENILLEKGIDVGKHMYLPKRFHYFL